MQYHRDKLRRRQAPSGQVRGQWRYQKKELWISEKEQKHHELATPAADANLRPWGLALF